MIALGPASRLKAQSSKLLHPVFQFEFWIRKRKDVGAVFSDGDGMLELGAEATISGADGPAIGFEDGLRQTLEHYRHSVSAQPQAAV